MKIKHYIYIVSAFAILGSVLWLIQPEQHYTIDPDALVTKNQDLIEGLENNTGGKKQEMIQLRFSWESGGIKYNDAIVMPKETYNKMTPEELEKIKQQRFDRWVETINKNSNVSN